MERAPVRLRPFLAALLLALAFCREATAPPGFPAQLDIVSGNLQQAVAGTPLPDPLIVKVTDSGGRPVGGQVVNFRVTAGGGSVFGGSAVTDQNGQAADRWTIGTSTADTQRVEVRAVRSDGTPIVFAVFRASALPGTAATLVAISPPGQVGDVLDPLPESLVVRVNDQFGNPVPGVNVVWSVTAGGGGVSPATSVTGVNGRTSAQWTLGPRFDIPQTALAAAVGSQTLTFFGLPGLPAGAAFVKVAGDGQSAPVGSPLDTLAVAIRTTGDRPLADALVNWSVSLNGGTLAVHSSRSDASGVARSHWTLGTHPGAGHVVTASTVPAQSGNRIPPSPVYFSATALIGTHFVQATAGGLGRDYRDFTCAVTQALIAYCWGNNGVGQLGVQTGNIFNPAARPVSGGIAFSSVSAGSVFACALRTDGALFCWGPQPATAVASALRFVAVSAGSEHYCALTTGGAGYCWGANTFGQLGTSDSLVSGGHTFATLSAGRYHSCGVTSAGAGLCWGRNNYGQLGVGPAVPNQSAPTPVAGSLTFSSVIALGFHSCGLTTGGTAYCWGYGGLGGLGTGDYANQDTPQPVSGGLVFAQLTGGDYHTCGLTPGGAAYCWGKGAEGELGDGTTFGATVPVLVTGGLTFAALSAGGYHTCGLTTGGVLYCWGSGYYGALGTGEPYINSTVPLRVAFQP